MSKYTSNIEIVSDTIADGATTSNGAGAEGKRAIGIILPSGLEGTNLTIETSFDGGASWHTLIDGGNDVTVKATSVGYEVFNENQMEGLEHVRLVADTAQTGAASLTWVFRP